MRILLAFLIIFSFATSSVCCGEFGLSGIEKKISSANILDHSTADHGSHCSDDGHCEMHCSHVGLVAYQAPVASEAVIAGIPVIPYSFIYANPYVDIFLRPPVLA